jgi:hypothetical protein
MKSEYKRIDLRTIEGIELAEKLVSDGFTVISSGFDTVMLERRSGLTKEAKELEEGLAYRRRYQDPEVINLVEEVVA